MVLDVVRGADKTVPVHIVKTRPPMYQHKQGDDMLLFDVQVVDYLYAKPVKLPSGFETFLQRHFNIGPTEHAFFYYDCLLHARQIQKDYAQRKRKAWSDTTFNDLSVKKEARL